MINFNETMKRFNARSVIYISVFITIMMIYSDRSNTSSADDPR